MVNIFLVTDNDRTREMFVKFLFSRGYELNREARSLDDAVKQILELPDDERTVVIIAADLGGSSGLECEGEQLAKLLDEARRERGLDLAIFSYSNSERQYWGDQSFLTPSSLSSRFAAAIPG